MFENKHAGHGFTIAEMLVAMVVVALVSAALVPMIKFYKAQPRKGFTPHGIAECYYQDGSEENLYLYTKDKVTGGSKDTSSVYLKGRRYCVLNIPKANYYELHVISAGTDGGGYKQDDVLKDDDGATNLVRHDLDIAIIETDNNYQNSINNLLPDSILAMWKQWEGKGHSAKQKFTIKAPLGKGNYTKNEQCLNAEGTSVACSFTYGFGNSGNTVSVETALKSTDTIVAKYPVGEFDDSVMSRPVLTIGENDIVNITATEKNGGDYDTNYGMYVCNGKIDDDCGNSLTLEKAGSVPVKNGPSGETGGESGRNFSIESTPLQFNYEIVDLSYKYGLSGKSGVIAKTYYKSFDKSFGKSTKLFLYPAPNYEETSYVYIGTSLNDKKLLFMLTPTQLKSDKYKDLKADEKYQYFKTLDIKSVTLDDFPVPKVLLNAVAADKKGKYYGSRKNELAPDKNYCDFYKTYEGPQYGMCIQGTGIFKKYYGNKYGPGAGGFGGYSMFAEITNKDLTFATMRDIVGQQELGVVTGSKEYTDTCILTNKEKVSSSYWRKLELTNEGTGYKPYISPDVNQMYYCAATRGNQGAIVLLW